MTCLSELMERGIEKMGALKVDKCLSDVFQFESDGLEEKLTGCCALGAMLLGAGIDADSRVDTSDALDWIAEFCPDINRETEHIVLGEYNDKPLPVGEVLWRMNDGCDVVRKPKNLHSILAWLKEQGL